MHEVIIEGNKRTNNENKSVGDTQKTPCVLMLTDRRSAAMLPTYRNNTVTNIYQSCQRYQTDLMVT